jgi:hypothetical protein
MNAPMYMSHGGIFYRKLSQKCEIINTPLKQDEIIFFHLGGNGNCESLCSVFQKTRGK